MQALNNFVIISETIKHTVVEGQLPIKKPSHEVVSVGKNIEDLKAGDHVVFQEFQGDRQQINGQEFIIVNINQVKAKI